MTPDEKRSATLDVKAKAYDELCDLAELAEYCEISNRNLAERVIRLYRQSKYVIDEIAKAKDTHQQFPCIQCGQPATCQCYKLGTEFARPLCEQCASVALANGEYNLVEEELP